MGLDMFFKKIRKVKNKTINDLLNIQEEINYSENTIEVEKLKNEYKEFLKEFNYSWGKKTYYNFDEEMGYLRKANFIHSYIIENFGGGVDNCEPIILTQENIKQLMDTIKEIIYRTKMKKGKIQNGYSYTRNKQGEIIKKPILENGYIMDTKSQKIANELLPTKEGFFFGSTNYDQYYYDDLLETYNICNELLKVDLSKYDIYYLASW